MRYNRNLSELPVISVVSFIYLVGILQGFVLVSALFFRRANRTANRLLALLCLIFALILLDAYFTRLNYYIKYPHFFLLVLPVLFLIGPLLYFYTLFLTRRRERFHARDLRHLLPPLLAILVFIPFYIKPGYEKIVDLEAYFPWIMAAQILNVGQCFVYLYLTFRILRRYQRRIIDVYSQVEWINLNWLKILLTVMTGLLGVYFMELLALLFFNWDFPYSYYGLILAIYLIGYWSMRQQPIAVLPESEEDRREEKSQIGRSRFEDGTVEQKVGALLKFMDEEKPYLEPSLNLNELAERLSLSPHNLSYIINSRLQKNFYQFVNHYRVEEVKRALAYQKKQKEDLLRIAFEAGFNTKATFNTIFKSHTGMTPSEYRRQVPNPPVPSS